MSAGGPEGSSPPVSQHLGRVDAATVTERVQVLADLLATHGRAGLACRHCAALWGMSKRGVEAVYLKRARELNAARAPALDAGRRAEWVAQLERVAHGKETPPSVQVAAIAAAARVEGYGLATTNNLNIAASVSGLDAAALVAAARESINGRANLGGIADGGQQAVGFGGSAAPGPTDAADTAASAVPRRDDSGGAA